MKQFFQPSRYWQLAAPAVAIVLFASLNSTAVHAAGPITVFQHVNEGGRAQHVGEGNVTIQKLRRGVGNDRISSISIEPGYTVLACQHSRLRGRCDTFTSDVRDLRTIGFNDVISSLKVSRSEDLSPVTAYQHVGFRGRSLNIDEPGVTTIQNLIDDGLGNDVISSIRITEGYTVRVCEHSRNGGSGRCEDLTSTISDLRTLPRTGISLNDNISYLEVTGPGVTQPNRAPTARDIRLPILADDTVSFTLAELMDASTDLDGDELTISVNPDAVQGSTVAVLTRTGDTYTYDPSDEFSALAVGETREVEFSYTVTDVAEETATASIIITVQGVVPEPTTFNLGDLGPGGGTVFMLNEEGTAGLEFAPQVLGAVAWGCFGTNLRGITDDLDGFADPAQQIPNQIVTTGLINSGATLDPGVTCASPAAQAALTYFTIDIDNNEFRDWYLPSIVELLQIRDLGNATAGDVGISETDFWSSTESTDEIAWSLLRNGEASPGSKEDRFSVLPVRTF